MSGEEAQMEEKVERLSADVGDLKTGHSQLSAEQAKMRDDIRDLQFNDKMQAQEISTLKESLTEIKSDTSWIRRKITGAIITATITAVVGGVIGIAIVNIF